MYIGFFKDVTAVRSARGVASSSLAFALDLAAFGFFTAAAFSFSEAESSSSTFVFGAALRFFAGLSSSSSCSELKSGSGLALTTLRLATRGLDSTLDAPSAFGTEALALALLVSATAAFAFRRS